jgi:hypothetical protein
MNERLESLLSKIEKSFDTGVDFLGEHASPYAQEVIAWHFWSNAITAVAFLAASLVLGSLACFWVKRAAKELGKCILDQDGHPFVFAAITVALTAVLAIFCLGHAASAAKAKIAPRVIIIDHIKGALK